MPNPPFTISGKVYDVDGSTVVEGVTVTLEDATTKETTTVGGLTNSAGEYSIQGANLTSGLTALDTLFLRVDVGKKSCEVLAKISAADLIAGIWDQDLYLRNTRQYKLSNNGTFAMIGANFGNFSAYDQHMWLLSRTQAASVPYDIVACIPVEGNKNEDFHFDRPILIDGGLRIIQTSGTSTVDPATLTAGVSNAIGDTSKQKVIVTVSTG